jgi:hypothetical protein
MKRIGLFLIYCLFALPLQAQTLKWQAFESAQGRFKAMFPGAPVVKHGKLRTEIGDVVTTQHSAGDLSGATYDITYNDYPRDGIAKLNSAKLLDTVRDGLVYQAKGKVVSEKPFTVGKVAGREQEIQGADGTRYRIRLLLVGNRIYQLTVMARPPDKAEEQRFFNSFQLTGTAR